MRNELGRGGCSDSVAALAFTLASPRRFCREGLSMVGLNHPFQDRPLGLIAGKGRFPFLVLEEARRRGIPVVTVAIKQEADPKIEDCAEKLHWVALGELSRCVRAFRRAGVTEAIMAGQVQHKQIFQVLRPDRLILKVLSRLRARNTDAILKAVADVLSEEGIELLDSTMLLATHLSTEGLMGRRRLSHEDEESIAFGYRMAREIARLDIGQTVVVKAKAVVAVEAMEGTDETIRRASRIVGSSRGGLIVIKVARPCQDMRFDVPVIGSRTIDVMGESGACVLAVEAGRCLLLEKEGFLRRANDAKIAVVGVEPEGARLTEDP